MFTSKQQLIKKSGKKGIDRPDYLKELLKEFQQTNSIGMLSNWADLSKIIIYFEISSMIEKDFFLLDKLKLIK